VRAFEIIYRAPSFLFAGFESEFLVGIEHRDDSNAASLTLRPPEREAHECASLAGNFIDVAPDIFDPRYAR
jgi:hypothetical protein